MLAVTGVTGLVGGAVAHELGAHGVPFIAIARHPDTLEMSANGDVRFGDLEDRGSLVAALRGVTSLVLVPPYTKAMGWYDSNAVDAAVEAGVQYVVRLSAIGCTPRDPCDSLRCHFEGERKLEATGLAYCHVRANSFHQNLRWLADQIKDEGGFWCCNADVSFAGVDARDVGAVLAVAALDKRHAGATYEVTGPRAISWRDVATAVSRVLGQEVACLERGSGELKERLVCAGWDQWAAIDWVECFAGDFYGTGKGGATTDCVARLAKRGPLSFDVYAAEFYGRQSSSPRGTKGHRRETTEGE